MALVVELLNAELVHMIEAPLVSEVHEALADIIYCPAWMEVHAGFY